jgi:hypothetical protein
VVDNQVVAAIGVLALDARLPSGGEDVQALLVLLKLE